MTKKEEVLTFIRRVVQQAPEKGETGITTQELAGELQMQRTNLSALLNELAEDGRLEKLTGRPVHYRLTARGSTTREDGSCFQALAGCSGTMRPIIQMAKAAILYPEHSLNTLIIGPPGSGKTSFAYLMYQFAQESHVIAADAPFIRFSSRNYEGQDAKEAEQQLFGVNGGALERARGGVLFLDSIEMLSADSRDRLLELVEGDDVRLRKTILICSADDKTRPALLEVCAACFPARVELPSLAARQLRERFELVSKFLTEEAVRMKKTLRVYAEVLYCLCLYRCENNIKQLKSDIRLGCANAYVRSFQSKEEELSITLDDFPAGVRRGLLFYKNNREKLEQLIPQQYSYAFSAERMRKENLHGSAMPEIGHLPLSDSVYDIIDRKAVELRSRGIGQEDISRIINAELEYDMKELGHRIVQNKVSRESLCKVVDRRIVDMVDAFLKEASARFNKVYPDTTFFGLCLHLSATLERGANSTQNLSNHRILEIVEQNRDEYALSMKFAAGIEQEFDVQLSIDETVFITLFLCGANLERKPKNTPVVLIAMHGDSTASSIADIVSALAQCENTFAYNMPLDKNMQQAYDEMKTLVQELERGQGILLLYDMGSLKTMAELIEKETGIRIACVAIPGTLIAVDASRRASVCTSLEELKQETLQSYEDFYTEVVKPESRSRSRSKRIIITLCMTGQGGAVQMKNYLEEHARLEQTDVVALSIGDRTALLAEVNRLKKEHEIRCVIGTYDPELHGIPFISIAQLFETPTDKLDILLSLSQSDRIQLNYEMIYSYLAEQLPTLDGKKLRKCLPKAMVGIKRAAHGLSEEQELGLFLHLACAVNRMQSHEEMPSKANREAIIGRNKRLYNNLKDILHDVEQMFDVHFTDDELAYVIGIIKKL